jgi:hypothetical protein
MASYKIVVVGTAFLPSVPRINGGAYPGRQLA